MGIHARLQFPGRVGRLYLDRKRAAPGITGRENARYRSLKGLARIRIDGKRGVPTLTEPGYRRLLHIERDLRVSRDEGEDRGGDLDDRTRSCETLGNDAVEWRSDLGLGEVDCLQFKGRLLLCKCCLGLSDRRLGRRPVELGVRIAPCTELCLGLGQGGARRIHVVGERLLKLFQCGERRGVRTFKLGHRRRIRDDRLLKCGDRRGVRRLQLGHGGGIWIDRFVKVCLGLHHGLAGRLDIEWGDGLQLLQSRLGLLYRGLCGGDVIRARIRHLFKRRARDLLSFFKEP